MAKDVKKTKSGADKLLIILIAVLVIVSIILIIVKIANGNNLDTNDKLVTELHNYFSTDDLSSCEGFINYTNDKIGYKDIDLATKKCLAYQKADIKSAQSKTIDAEKKKETCVLDDMTFRIDDGTKECTISIIKQDIIDNAYVKLFGQKMDDTEAFNTDHFHICYLKDGNYYCGLSETFTYTLGSESTIYRVIDKAVEKGDKLTIYDHFAKLNDNVCYKYYTSTDRNSECTDAYLKNNKIDLEIVQKHGTAYKHEYKKASDGSYYWVSSEPIK